MALNLAKVKTMWKFSCRLLNNTGSLPNSTFGSGENFCISQILGWCIFCAKIFHYYNTFYVWLYNKNCSNETFGPKNLKKYSSYFWQECRVLCAQQCTCQKVDKDFSKQMWSSRIIQTLQSILLNKKKFCLHGIILCHFLKKNMLHNWMTCISWV